MAGGRQLVAEIRAFDNGGGHDDRQHKVLDGLYGGVGGDGNGGDGAEGIQGLSTPNAYMPVVKRRLRLRWQVQGALLHEDGVFEGRDSAFWPVRQAATLKDR